MIKSKRIPVSAAAEIGKKFNKDQVIVVAWDLETGETWVTTWGSNKVQCVQAAEGGNFVKKALGWPNELTQTKSASEKSIRKKIIAELQAKLDTFDKTRFGMLNHYEVRDIDQALKELE